MASVVRGLITRGDLANWDGRTATATRVDATGGTVTGLAVGDRVDVLQVYGQGTSRTSGTISTAVSNLGASRVSIVFAPGTWAIDSNVTVPSNIHAIVPQGCIFDISTGITLTFSGTVDVEDPANYAIGLGTVTIPAGLSGARHLITAAEITAGVTPVAYQYDYGILHRYGPTADGTTDDSTVVKTWASVAVDNSVLRAVGTFRCESTVTDPGTLVANQHGCLFDGLTGVTIDCSGATFVQTVTSSGASQGGIIALKDCVDCTVIARSTGYADAGIGLESAATVALIGACKGCRVIAVQDEGRAACLVISSDATNSGDLPSHCDVTAIAENSTRACIAQNVGGGMTYLVHSKNCDRSFFCFGTHGPGYLNLTSINADVSDLNLTADGDGSVIDGLTVDAHFTDCQSNMIVLAPSQVSGETGIIRNVTVRGSGTRGNVGTASSISITQFNDDTSQLINVDLSGFTVYHGDDSTSITFQPDDSSAVIKSLKLPKVVTTDTPAQHVVQVNNTAGATIDGLKVSDIIAGSAAGSWQCLVVTGAVKNLDLSHTRLEQAGGSASFSASGTACDGVNMIGAISPRGLIAFQGSTRVVAAPARIVQGGTEGPIHVGGLFDNAPMGGVTTWVSSTGSATVNELNWGHIGQQVTIITTGGTQTLTHGAQLVMISGANVVFGTDADSVVMVCTVETAGSQVWVQVA